MIVRRSWTMYDTHPNRWSMYGNKLRAVWALVTCVESMFSQKTVQALNMLAGLGSRVAKTGCTYPCARPVGGSHRCLSNFAQFGSSQLGRLGDVSVRVRARRSFLEDFQEEKREELLLDNEDLLVSEITYEKPLQICKYPDPRLRKPNKKIKFPVKGAKELAKDMFEIMYQDDGVGLAAPQVGVNVQMMVFNPEGIEGKGDPLNEWILLNPRIVKYGGERDWFKEGCLSFPKMLGDVKRPTYVKVIARNVEGKKMELKLKGWKARIFQHEYDHLQGVLFFERMDKLVLEEVQPQLLAFEEEFISKNPGVKVKRLQAA